MKKRMLKIMSMGVTACLLLGTTPTPMLTKAAVTETANHIANKSKESERTEPYYHLRRDTSAAGTGEILFI